MNRQKEPDDFARMVGGFVLGLIMAVISMAANMLFLEWVSREFSGRGNPVWVLVEAGMTGQLLLFGMLPVFFGALLTRTDRVRKSKLIFRYCYIGLAVFLAATCTRDINFGGLIPMLLVGIGGLMGIGLTQLAQRFYFAKRGG